jgi:hypothetical protein
MENPLDALQALLDERGRYEQWLSQLAMRREQTPAHVYERVRGDYSARLDGVMDQLRSRAADLEGTASSLEQRVNDLVSQETARRDARAEIELRAIVGEFATDRAEGELAACDTDIARLVGEREGVSSELHRMQEILGFVRQPVVTAPAAGAPAPAAAPAEPAPAQAATAPEAPAAERDSGGFDELAFLHSVVDGPAPVTGPAPIADRPPPPPPPPPAPVRSAVATPSATPVFLKGMPTEQVKTLRCQECGTMNYPTEWYCERCGGELAAM